MHNEQLTTSLVKDRIKTDFGTISRFCTLTGQMKHYQSIRYLLNYKGRLTASQSTRLNRQNRLCDTYTDKPLPEEITPEERQWISAVVKFWYGSIHKFCAEHKELARCSVYDILRGDTKKKNTTFHMCMDILLAKNN